MEVSIPSFIIGYKDKVVIKDIVKRHIAIEIILSLLIGKSSNLYRELYNSGLMLQEAELAYEFTDNYAHVMIGGQSKEPKKVQEFLNKEIENMKKSGFNEEDFNRIKRMIYGDYIKEYNEVGDISRMFLSDYFKGINSFDYIEEIEKIDMEYVMSVLKEVFNEDKQVISIVEPLN